MSLTINDLQKEKWYIISYRYNNDRYIFKFKDIKSDNSVNIYLGVYMTGQDKKLIDTWYTLQGYDISEATSEEVYQYFPEEKPKNIILITNGIYVASNGNIFKWGNTDSQFYIRVLSKEFRKGGGCFKAEGSRNANEEEMIWMEACINSNKFIPKEEAEKIEKSQSKEENLTNNKNIINEAIKRYPIGSKFKDLVHNQVFEVEKHIFNDYNSSKWLYVNVKSGGYAYNKNARIYFDGQWAEVITKENLVGRWIRALVENAEASKVEEGKFYKIISESPYNIEFMVNLLDREVKMGISKGRNYYELMPIGFEPPKDEKKDTYEIGKWYKLNNCWWAKNIRIRDGVTRYEENISSSGIYNSAGGSVGFIIPISEKPIDLSEIQQYLPEGHVDRIKSSEFKVGDWVTLTSLEGQHEYGTFTVGKAYQLGGKYFNPSKGADTSIGHFYVIKDNRGNENGCMLYKYRRSTLGEIEYATGNHQNSGSWTGNSSSSASSFVTLNYGTKGDNNYTSGQEPIIKIDADVCNIKIAKSAPVTLKNTEKEVKINVKSNQKVTILNN